MAMNYVTFNQDYSHMAVGTSNGFRVYYTDPFSKAHETHDGDIALLEMLFSTSLVALVLSPRRLVITNTKRNSTICELTFPTTILGVRLNRKRLVIVLEDQIYLYDISNMKLVHTIDTSANPHGLAALSPSNDACYLAYPLPQKPPSSSFAPPSHVPPTSPTHALTSGHVLLFDALSLTPITIIEAHRSPLSCITISASGHRLATASDKGTIIRVFSLPDGKKLAQFRRGTMPARIFSMSFNATATLLCVSSATETVHVFKLAPTGQAQGRPNSANRSPSDVSHRRRDSNRSMSPPNELDDGADKALATDVSITARAHDGTFSGMLRRTSQTVGKTFAASVAGYLPTSVTEMLEPARDFAWFKLSHMPPGPGVSAERGASLKSVVAMSRSSPQVMVVTSEGQFLVYNIDLERGGEGTLTQQHSVFEGDERGRQTGEM